MTVLLGILCVVMPLVCVFCYRQGMKDAAKIMAGEKLDAPAGPKREIREEETDEQKAARELMERVEKYDVGESMK